MTPPIAAAEATAEPEIAPNSILARILQWASEHGRRPPRIRAKLINRRAIPPWFIMLPDKIKNGIANNVKLSNPEANFWETTLNAELKSSCVEIDASVDKPMA